MYHVNQTTIVGSSLIVVRKSPSVGTWVLPIAQDIAQSAVRNQQSTANSVDMVRTSDLWL